MSRWFAGLALSCILLNGFTSCKLLRHPAVQAPKADTLLHSSTNFIGPTKDSGNVAVAQKDTTTVPEMSAEKKMLIESVKPLFQQQYSYTTFSGKAKMHYEEKDNQKDFTAHFRIKKDSVIWINITALGGMIPVAKILITPDSLKLINQIDREAMLMPLSQATRLLPVPADFSTLQNFIVGNALRSSGWISDAVNTADGWAIQAEDSNYIQLLNYNKSDSTLRSGQMHTRNPNSPQGVIQYKQYTLVQDKKFSFQRSIHIENAGAAYNLDMDFTNANFNEALDYSFSVPKNYTVNPRK